jgi:hypothetical protein
LSALPLRESTAWCPFNPFRFCQPITRADDERHALIAMSAYLRAQRRHFESGRELEDWLAAEAELNRRLDRPQGAVQSNWHGSGR